MFSVTRDAASELNSLIEQMGATEPDCLRLKLQGNQATLTMDRPRDSDHVFKYEDRNVLVVDEEICSACASMHLDHEEDASFVMTPNTAEAN